MARRKTIPIAEALTILEEFKPELAGGPPSDIEHLLITYNELLQEKLAGRVHRLSGAGNGKVGRK